MLHTVPFERNGERVKELRYQRIMELEAGEPPHSFIYMDEAGFNLTKRRRRGRNITGHRATVDVPGQQEHNHGDLIPEQERDQIGDDLPKYIIVWDNVSFHCSNIIRMLDAGARMLMEFLPPYSPFLNPFEEFLSAWRWKVYNRQPHTQMTLLAAMDAVCDDITADACTLLKILSTLHHKRRYSL
ncbi:hypothetical protein SRHO_G00097980 [Serrasalmus rhombeus]